MDVSAKLQIKPGQRIATVGMLDDVPPIAGESRDLLSAALTGEGVQPVRQVAIDEVWSALRFRPA